MKYELSFRPIGLGALKRYVDLVKSGKRIDRFRCSLRGISMEEARHILGSCGPEIDIIVARSTGGGVGEEEEYWGEQTWRFPR